MVHPCWQVVGNLLPGSLNHSPRRNETTEPSPIRPFSPGGFPIPPRSWLLSSICGQIEPLLTFRKTYMWLSFYVMSISKQGDVLYVPTWCRQSLIWRGSCHSGCVAGSFLSSSQGIFFLTSLFLFSRHRHYTTRMQWSYTCRALLVITNPTVIELFMEKSLIHRVSPFKITSSDFTSTL